MTQGMRRGRIPGAVAHRLSDAANRLPLLLLSFYQAWISPALHTVFPSSCGYQPTCSQYATDAILLYGPIVGSWMALQRLLRCHPFARGGFDPVPLPGVAHRAQTAERCAAGHVPACALREPLP